MVISNDHVDHPRRDQGPWLPCHARVGDQRQRIDLEFGPRRPPTLRHGGRTNSVPFDVRDDRHQIPANKFLQAVNCKLMSNPEGGDTPYLESPVKDDQTFEPRSYYDKEYVTGVLVGTTPTSATSVRAVDQRGQPVRCGRTAVVPRMESRYSACLAAYLPSGSPTTATRPRATWERAPWRRAKQVPGIRCRGVRERKAVDPSDQPRLGPPYRPSNPRPHLLHGRILEGVHSWSH